MTLDFDRRQRVTGLQRAMRATRIFAAIAACAALTVVPSGGSSQSTSNDNASEPLTICQTNVEKRAGESTVERSAGEVSNVVQKLSKRIYSPYCPGKTLSMCPSGGAASVRRDIQRLAREGWSVRAIERAVLDACGEEYRLKEPPAGDNYMMLTVVALGLLLCLFAIWYFSRGGGEDPSGDEPPDSDDSLDGRDRQRLDDIRHEYRE